MAALFAGALAAVKTAGVGGSLMAAGTVLSGAGAIQQSQAAKASSEFTAKQLEASGTAERAAASLQAGEEAKKKELVISRARAVGAASGGGQDYALLGALEEEGTYRTLFANWQGEEAAKGRQAQADATRADGKSESTAALYGGLANTLVSGGNTWQAMYAPKKPEGLI